MSTRMYKTSSIWSVWNETTARLRHTGCLVHLHNTNRKCRFPQHSEGKSYKQSTHGMSNTKGQHRPWKIARGSKTPRIMLPCQSKPPHQDGGTAPQTKWPYDAIHSWNNWFYYNKKKNNTREGEGRNILYRDATNPCRCATGRLFRGGGEGKKRGQHTAVKLVSHQCDSHSSVANSLKKEKKRRLILHC